MTAWTIAAFTHRGRVRTHNEDAVALGNRILTGDMDAPLVISTPNDRCLLMIADGMGGHAHGAMASSAALNCLMTLADRLADPATCAQAIEDANQHIYALMQEHEEALGMGSTLVGAVLTADRLLAFNVGDSRSYLFSAGQLVQLSHDDIPEEGIDDLGPRRSHALTQALGGSSLPLTVEPHVAADPPLAPGETLLLCSDGLTDMVDDQVISQVLASSSDPDRTVRDLVGKAFRMGARDNISLIIARRGSIPSGSDNDLSPTHP